MIIIDGETFNIPILPPIKRTGDFLDKYAERTADGILHRELIGVYFNYQIKFAPTANVTEYARLWAKLTEPVEFHTVTVPDEDGDYTFTAYFSNVGDEIWKATPETGTNAARRFFKNLTVNFKAKEPART